jgi:cobyrinic acid a,c-diamide synthase
MTASRHAFVVAGPASGVGKTTIALGLMAACRRRGLAVQPFKCGPDFIDAGHHTRACGRRSRNVDGWMLSGDTNREVFARYARTADVAIVEGVMGLFDGAGASGGGSTAAMAALLGLPVLFVVDASRMAGSVAPLVRGFEGFDPAVRIAGVVFNQVGGAGHYALLHEALERAGGARALGYVPADAAVGIPERHLGLHTAEEGALSATALDRLAWLVEQHVDLDRLLELSRAAPAGQTRRVQPRAAGDPVRIAVARDRAFCFYYEDNLDALRAAGGEIVEFSPLSDRTLPDGTQALYLGGGYPELYARELSANVSMRDAVARFVAEGGATYAECGGLMYLGRYLQPRDAARVPMVGVLPFGTAVTDRLVGFGYAEVSFTADCLLGGAGATARGHSFHYSTIDRDATDDPPDVTHAYRVRSTLSGAEGPEGFVTGNVLASYVHLHFLSNPELGPNFVRAARLLRARPRSA